MTTLSKKLNTEIVKSHIPNVQLAIKELLKVDAGKQAAYHIFAVCNFLKNDQTLKSEIKKETYAVTTNMGSSAKPCEIKHTIGDFECEYAGKMACEDFLRDCKIEAKWNILVDGEVYLVGGEYKYTIRTMPRPEKGLELKLSLKADNYRELNYALERVKSQVEDEFNCWNDDTYCFEIYGDEFEEEEGL